VLAINAKLSPLRIAEVIAKNVAGFVLPTKHIGVPHESVDEKKHTSAFDLLPWIGIRDIDGTGKGRLGSENNAIRPSSRLPVIGLFGQAVGTGFNGESFRLFYHSCRRLAAVLNGPKYPYWPRTCDVRNTRGFSYNPSTLRVYDRFSVQVGSAGNIFGDLCLMPNCLKGASGIKNSDNANDYE
jgi:hypothetical protein